MNGYQYLVQRNRLMYQLEDELKKIEHLPEAERNAAAKRLEAQFDIQLRELYSGVATEYPGERKIKAHPLTDPR
jgi:ribosome-binding protein aMBF1 (putative translation factor)